MRRWLLILALAAGLVLVTTLAVITRRIERQSSIDEARPADIIVVLGAAEYNGRPSPVLRARLDHAYDLFRRGLAPLIFTTGGAGGDTQYTEGEVGRDYLVRRGVPSESIVVEGEGDTTVETLITVSEIMRRSSGGNWALEKYNPFPGVHENAPASKGYAGGFGTDLMLKDLGLAQENAMATKASTPLGGLARAIYAAHSIAGHGGEDFSSVIKMLQKKG